MLWRRLSSSSEGRGTLVFLHRGPGSVVPNLWRRPRPAGVVDCPAHMHRPCSGGCRERVPALLDRLRLGHGSVTGGLPGKGGAARVHRLHIVH